MRLGLVGHPVKHSLSPPMHRAAFLFFGIEGSYELYDIEPDEFAVNVRKLIDSGLCGFNATIPHKNSALELCEPTNHSVEANLVGAANTVRVDSSGNLHAHNTDLIGFMNALAAFTAADSALPIAPLKRALVLGSGGAARACILGLILAGYSNVDVLSRSQHKAESACLEIRRCVEEAGIHHDFVLSALESGSYYPSPNQIIVNCTPIGLIDDSVPDWIERIFAESKLSSGRLFFDTVYKPDLSPTLLMELSSKHGFRSCDGLSMLIEQAAHAFQFWTGRLPPHDLLRSAVIASLHG